MARKVCVVITARPSYSRVRTILSSLKRRSDVELQVVVAASALLERYGNTVQNIEADGFRIDARVFSVLEGETPTTMAKSTGLGLLELATVFDNLKPDVVLTHGDRYETLATAIAATYMNVPLAHTQGGEVTGSIDEKVRHAVTKLADVHFVSTQTAVWRVVRMGEDPAAVFCTGCPSIDLAAEVLGTPQLDFDPFEKYGGVGARPDLDGGYLVVMQHPVTTEYEAARQQVTETLLAVRDSNLPALWFWPNVDAGSDGIAAGIRAFRELEAAKNIHFFKNMKPRDFLRLVKSSRCLVGNSSVAIRECAFLGVPVVNVGSRQAGRERAANVVDVSCDRTEIAEAIRSQLRHGPYRPSNLYGDGRAGVLVAELLATVPLKHDKRWVDAEATSLFGDPAAASPLAKAG